MNVLLILEQEPQRFFDGLDIESFAIEGDQRRRPVERFGDPGLLVELGRAKLLTNAVTCSASVSETPGTFAAMMRRSVRSSG